MLPLKVLSALTARAAILEQPSSKRKGLVKGVQNGQTRAIAFQAGVVGWNPTRDAFVGRLLVTLYLVRAKNKVQVILQSRDLLLREELIIYIKH